jgi:hypothetical protein
MVWPVLLADLRQCGPHSCLTYGGVALSVVCSCASQAVVRLIVVWLWPHCKLYPIGISKQNDDHDSMHIHNAHNLHDVNGFCAVHLFCPLRLFCHACGVLVDDVLEPLVNWFGPQAHV